MEDHQNGKDRFQRSPTGPSVAAPGISAAPPPAPSVRATGRTRSVFSVIIFVLLASGIGIRAWRDLSRPDAFDYWKDQYIAPSLTAALVGKVELGTGPARRALQVGGTIGPAAATLLRDRLDEAGLAAGDLVLLSSPGGDLYQAVIMGEMIRSRGLATAVGTADGSGRVRPGYCASACVLVYAGGKPRFGVLGSALGVHRFVTTKPTSDPVADTQKIAGAVLGYMTKMGVSSSVVEAMSETREIRWLSPQQALTMNLVTDPVGKP